MPLSSPTSMTHQPTARQSQENSLDSHTELPSQPFMFPSPAQPAVASSAKDVYVQNLKNVFTPETGTFSLRRSIVGSKMTCHSSAIKTSNIMCQASDKRTSSFGLFNNKHFKVANVEPSMDSSMFQKQSTYTHVIKRKARRHSHLQATVPLSYVKTLPPEKFDTPWDYNAYPYIRRLIDLAPCDAQYSDGDFMCRFDQHGVFSWRQTYSLVCCLNFVKQCLLLVLCNSFWSFCCPCDLC